MRTRATPGTRRLVMRPGTRHTLSRVDLPVTLSRGVGRVKTGHTGELRCQTLDAMIAGAERPD